MNSVAPNKGVQLTRLRGLKIVTILKTGLGPTAFPIDWLTVAPFEVLIAGLT